MTLIPVNNQVLEKREGYSQIFNAFSMVDLALQLDWKGKEEVYSGESKIPRFCMNTGFSLSLEKSYQKSTAACLSCKMGKMLL